VPYVQLTAVAVFGYQTVLYKSYVMPESFSNISQHDSGTAISTRRCALCCTREEECYGFIYDLLTKKCSVKTCVNPNLYSEVSSNGYDFYIRADVGGQLSKLLARSEQFYLLYFVLTYLPFGLISVINASALILAKILMKIII